VRTCTSAPAVNFNTEFNTEVYKIYKRIFYSLNFDQMSLKITDKKKGVSKYYGNNYINTDCLYKAIKAAGSAAECK